MIATWCECRQSAVKCEAEVASLRSVLFMYGGFFFALFCMLVGFLKNEDMLNY